MNNPKEDPMKTFLVALFAFAGPAYATGSPPAPDVPQTHSEASAASKAAAVGAGVGVAKAEGGAGGNGYGGVSSAYSNTNQTQTANGQANNEGNELSVSTRVERSAPSLGQGGLYNSGCGAGLNGGGSTPGGAGFLGATWTTHDCYLFLLAQRYESIGMADTACDILNSTRAAKRAFERLGINAPDCKLKASETTVIGTHTDPILPAIDLSQYVTRDELVERDRRIMQRTTAK
jgi:hypothetical protein